MRSTCATPQIQVVDGALRLHRRLNVDCRIGARSPRQAFRDLHFRLRGRCAQLMEVFADDWQFTTDEALRGAKWFPPLAEAGLSRGAIEAGPDEASNACAGRSRRPDAAQRPSRSHAYFIPDQTLVAGARRRGGCAVSSVDIREPELATCRTCTGPMFGQLCRCSPRLPRVGTRPGRFTTRSLGDRRRVDACSARRTGDARSLPPEFRVDVECYRRRLGAHLDGMIQARISASRALTLEASTRGPAGQAADRTARSSAPYSDRRIDTRARTRPRRAPTPTRGFAWRGGPSTSV